MVELPQLQTRRATDKDLDPASEVLGLAFADYAWTRWTVDGDRHQDRVRALQRLSLERFGLPFGEVWLTTMSGVVHCVAVWMDSSAESPSAVGEAVADVVRELEGERHDASVAAEHQIAGWRPSERHLLLATVGTRPVGQGRGLASRTLAPVLRRADAEAIPAFLETSSPRNVDFYARLGFEVVGHEQIQGGGPDVWAMLRRPGPPVR